MFHVTPGFSSSLPSSMSGKTKGNLETVTFNSTQNWLHCQNLHPYSKRNTLATAMKETSVPMSAAKGRQQSVVLPSCTCALVIKALENLNLPVQRQASNFLMVEWLSMSSCPFSYCCPMRWCFSLLKRYRSRMKSMTGLLRWGASNRWPSAPAIKLSSNNSNLKEKNDSDLTWSLT